MQKGVVVYQVVTNKHKLFYVYGYEAKEFGVTIAQLSNGLL